MTRRTTLSVGAADDQREGAGFAEAPAVGPDEELKQAGEAPVPS